MRVSMVRYKPGFNFNTFPSRFSIAYSSMSYSPVISLLSNTPLKGLIISQIVYNGISDLLSIKIEG